MLLADREFWPTRTSQNQQWSQAKLPEKTARLRQQLRKLYSATDPLRNNETHQGEDPVASNGSDEENDSALKTLCTSTLFEFNIALFKGNVSLPMFRLYCTCLSRYKTRIQDLFRSSYGIDRELVHFVRPLEFAHYFGDTTVEWPLFRTEVSALPKLADILRVLSLNVEDKGSWSSVSPGNIIIIKGYLRQWRIFKKQLDRDRHILSYYGAWFYIWDALIVREEDFQMTVEYGVLDNRHAIGTGSYTYDDFEWLVRSYRTQPEIVEVSIYRFVRNLNEDITLGTSLSASPRLKMKYGLPRLESIIHPSP